MKLETLFEKFEQFADAPGAVGRMRKLVLHLGVNGQFSTGRESWTKHLWGNGTNLSATS